ncbi:MAG: hypothetical protein AB7P16_23450 [Bradyrhizobium sp.]|uniref:hypothetical protein n=1 Tax=Bradyrhizobium sp. TaxID=376 RepID=UPI003D1454D2
MKVNAGLVSGVRWRLRVQFNDEAGAPLPMTGYTFRARMWKKDLLGGTPVFEWKQSGGGASDGTISVALAAQGAIDLTATKTQHAAVTAGDYNWQLEDITTAADPVRLAVGRLQVGPDGTLVTAFWAQDSFDGSIATGIVPVDGAAIAAQAAAAMLTASLPPYVRTNANLVSGNYTLLVGDIGKPHVFDMSSDFGIIVPATFGEGWHMSFDIKGAGAGTFQAGGAGTLKNRWGFYKASTDAHGGLWVRGNADGTHAITKVFGDLEP